MHKKKKGVILAGGKGTRLHPITLEIPKPLITVKKKPLINYSIETFARHNINDIKVIIKPADREDYRKWMKVYGEDFVAADIAVEVVEEAEPMGTFGFIAHHLGDWMGEGDLFVTNSDDIKDVDLSGMQEAHAKSGAAATIALMTVEKPDDYGVVVLDGTTVKKFLEKQKDPPGNIVSVGMYVISPKAIEYASALVKKGQKFIMIEKDIFPVMATDGTLEGFMHHGKFYDCGTLEKWEKMIQEL
jgi:NDP-sugar pyrophosphorylase family protein